MHVIALALLQVSVPVARPPLQPPPQVELSAPAPLVILARDTPVELMAPTEVSTDHAKPGTRFKLRVNKPVVVNGRTIVPVGTPAYGEVVTASASEALGVSGKMTARLIAIRLGEVEIPLDGQVSAKGTGAGSAGMAILFTGVAGLFHRGNNAKIKAGELVTGFVAHDIALDVSGPSPRLAVPAPLPVSVAPPAPTAQ